MLMDPHPSQQHADLHHTVCKACTCFQNMSTLYNNKGYRVNLYRADKTGLEQRAEMGLEGLETTFFLI